MLYVKMNPEVKVKWLAALESGEYRRGTGQLLNKDKSDPDANGYCCLGVLCDLAIKEGIRKQPVPQPMNSKSPQINTSEGMRRGVYLPPKVQKWAGLTGEAESRLAAINDIHEDQPGKFVKVVEWIKENL